MFFHYPTFIDIDYKNEIECEHGRGRSIARILSDDIDSLVLSNDGQSSSKADKGLVCKAVSVALHKK